jgi:hypothetical protein
MTLVDKLKVLEERVVGGQVEYGDLALALEPLLWQVCVDRSDEEWVRRILNQLERIRFTLRVEDQRSAVVQLLKVSQEFAEKRIFGGDGSAR